MRRTTGERSYRQLKFINNKKSLNLKAIKTKFTGDGRKSAETHNSEPVQDKWVYAQNVSYNFLI